MSGKQDFSLKETSPNIGGGRVFGREKLTSSYDLVEQMQFLYVRIVRARNLTSPDPFVEVSLGKCGAKTRKYENFPFAEWNQVVAFDKSQGDDVIIQLKDTQMPDGEIIGQRKFNVADDIPTRVPPDCALAPQWLQLVNVNGARVSAELMLSIWLGTQADEMYSEAWHFDSLNVSNECIMNTRPKVYLSPRLCYVRVNIIQAHLVAPKKNRKSHVYVKVYLGNYFTLRTRFLKIRSVNPVWNEDVMLVAADPLDDHLIVGVMDRLEDGKEECLGRFRTQLTKIAARQSATPVAEEWYELYHPGAKVGGIQMRLSLDQGYHVLDETINSCSDYKPYDKELWTPTIGVLEVGILSATDLQPIKTTNGIKTIDAYCVAKYGNKWVRTRTIVGNLSPKWNEQYTWDVYDPHTVITIGVFDNCHLQTLDSPESAKDLRIGKVRIRLSTLQTDNIYTYSYPLIVLNPQGVMKMGEIQLAVRFTCSSMFKMMQTYQMPLLPQMHFDQPLSVIQLQTLRQQALYIIRSRLNNAEPPMREEVIMYMLDVDYNLWSMRKSKANLDRVFTCFSGLITICKLFEDICIWKKPIITILAHILFLIVVFFPELLLPCFFYCYFIMGVWKYRKRPKHPACIDFKLSKAGTTPLDEIDEEFDTFPSSRPENVVRMRYDRLRSVTGRIMMMLGDLAGQGERVNALISWRDTRATTIFVVFCFVAGTLTWMISLQALIIFLGFYVMRHPLLRGDDGPSLPQNFFRRLPTQTDSML